MTGDIGYLSKLTDVTGIQFRYTPASYHYSWHNAPSRQFVINLDGDVEVEVSGGEKKIIKQGQVFFVEDTTGNLCTRVILCQLYTLFPRLIHSFSARS